MSDFFAGVHGARFPDVVMNKGPLPGTGGLPAPLHDTVDGRINYNSSLLGDIEPYAYGEPGYLSSQNSYLNIPHKIQKIVPFLYLPNPDGTDSFRLNHPIDDGDIAFTLRLDRNSEVCSGLSNRAVQRSGLGTAIDPMINLCTLNYILAGMQICTPVANLRDKWDRLLYYLDSTNFQGNAMGAPYNFEDINRVVRHLIRPFGIAHGSEKQGGQHEGSLSAVTWPVSFVISLTLDGKDANLVNIWHKHDVEAGNDLVLRLKPVPIPPGGKYTLNHWGKGLVEKVFTPNTLQSLHDAIGTKPTHVWQLVPDIFSLDYEMSEEGPAMQDALNGLSPQFLPANREYSWQEEGYWHIARAQIHTRKYGLEEFYYNDMANNLRTGHMDVTFQPTYYKIPSRNVADQNGPAILDGPHRNVFNLIGASPDQEWQSSLRLERGFQGNSEPDPKRPRLGNAVSRASVSGQGLGDGMVSTGRLSGREDGMVSTSRLSGLEDGMVSTSRLSGLEDGMVSTSRLSGQEDGMVSTSRLSGLEDGMVSTSRLSGREDGMVSTSRLSGREDGMVSTSRLSGLEDGMISTSRLEDGMVSTNRFEDRESSNDMVSAGRLSNNVSSIPASTSLAALQEDIGEFEDGFSSTAHTFSVAKPGLASKAKRPKSKGIMGSILSADGSVTREQSRML